MRAIFFFLLLQIAIENTSGQMTQKLNLIIVVDENIVVAGISNVQIQGTINNKNETIELSYYPGSLSVNDNNFSKLFTETAKPLLLKFDFSEYHRERKITYSYQVEIKKEWFKEKFFILKIYNLIKEKYKKKFNAVDKNKDYVYEIDSPSYTTRLINNSRH